MLHFFSALKLLTVASLLLLLKVLVDRESVLARGVRVPKVFDHICM